MLPQQQPGTPIKAQTAPGAAASSADGVHRRNLASLGGPVPFGLAVFWVFISFIGSILQLAGLVRGGGAKKETTLKKKELDNNSLSFLFLEKSTSPGRSPVLRVPLRSPGIRTCGQLPGSAFLLRDLEKRKRKREGGR